MAEHIINFLNYLWPFIIVIGLIIFVHELGHFLAAKFSGVRVEEFSLGFPPKMFGFKWGETEYRIAWIPLGGYVKMSGMMDESFDDTVDLNDPRGFNQQTLWRKVMIIVGGVVMNFLAAWVIYSIITFSSGISSISGNVISQVSPEFPAAEIGLQPGDKIVEIAGSEITEWSQITDVIRNYPGIPVRLSYYRGDSLRTDTIIPRALPEFNLVEARIDTVGKIGIAGTITTKDVGLFSAMGYGANQVGAIIYLNIVSIKALVTGGASVKELSGPLGIAKMSGESAKGGLANFFGFIALISVSIGFLNILPIPMLDGGHLLFILIESVIRRPIPEKIKLNLMRVGLGGLLLLIVVVSYNDILRILFK